MMKLKFILANAAIIALAAALRFSYLGTLPSLMLQDEAATGFNAISIAKTGRDEWGTKLPTIFKSFGDNKPPLYIYATALIYKAIGWTPVLPRLASALAGTLLVLVISLWLKRHFKSDNLALVGALITAVSPWTIYLSRLGLESNLGLLFFAAGLLFLENVSEKPTKLSIAASTFFFVLSTYTYHSYRFITGTFLFLVVFHSIISKKAKKDILPLAIIFILAATCILPGVFSRGSLTRFGQTSVVQPTQTASIFDYYRGTCYLMSANLNILPLRTLCSGLWNRPSISLSQIGQSVVDHLSPSFLFFRGDTTLNRNPTSQGEFFIFLYPFFLVGGFIVISKWKKYFIYSLGFLVTLVPSMLTGTPHTIRLSAQIPFVIFIIILGLKHLQKQSKYVLPLTICLLGAFSVYSLTKYALVTYSESQQFLSHSKEISTTAYAYYQKGYVVYFDQEILPEPHVFFTFWNNMDPNEYQVTNKIIATDEKGFMRPEQIGDRLFFYRPEIDKMVCDPKIIAPTIFITSQPLPFAPEKTIMNNTGVYKLGSFYDLTAMRAQTPAMTQFCK